MSTVTATAKDLLEGAFEVLLARYTGHRAGHAMTNRLLRALFAVPTAWQWETCSPALEDRLPGAGVAAYDLAPTAWAAA